MLCYHYPNDNRLPQLYAGEHVFDRVLVIVTYEHDIRRRGHWLSSTHGLPCIRTRDLSTLGRADTFFILEPALFKGLEAFIAERSEENSTIHLLGNLK